MKLLQFSLFATLLFLVQSFAISVEVVDRIVVIVNDDVITTKDLESIFIPIQKEYQESYKGRVLKNKILEAKKILLDRMIEQTLIYQDCVKKHILIKEDRIQNALDNIKKRFPSEDNFYKILKSQELTITILKKNLRKQIAIQNYKENFVFPLVKISEKEIKKYYKNHKKNYFLPTEIRLQQIFVPFKNASEKEIAHQQIKKTLYALKKGAHFESLVKKHAQESSHSKNGDLGFLKIDQMIKPMREKVSKLSIGQISPIVESDSGFHIFKLITKKNQRFLAFPDVKDKIYQLLFSEKSSQKYQKIVDDLKKKAYIKKKMDNFL